MIDTAEALPDRIARLIQGYDSQGIHRTGTAVDNASADWLAREIRAIGLEPEKPSFALSRVEVIRAEALVGSTVLTGLPRFDAPPTGPKGVTGVLGPIGGDTPIGLAVTDPRSTPETETLREKFGHRAIIQVTDGGMPGLCPINADRFTEPFGPPLLQLSNEHTDVLEDAVAAGATVEVTIETERYDSRAFNVTARVPGRDTDLPPLIVMTPRSGWWSCASERGGGLVVFCEIMRSLAEAAPAREVIFTANSGHELGHLGLMRFIEDNPGIIGDAHCWIHLGANFGSAVAPRVRFQAANEELRVAGLNAFASQGLALDWETPVGERPGGEAREIFDHGGRYVSLLGGNGLFHNPTDHWPDAIDVDKTVKLAQAFTMLARKLAGASE